MPQVKHLIPLELLEGAGNTDEAVDAVVIWLKELSCRGENVRSCRGCCVTADVVVTTARFLPPPDSPWSRSLQRSEVQRHAEMASDSTGSGEHWPEGVTGSSRLPSRMLVEKHSRITAEIKKFKKSHLCQLQVGL